MFGLVIILDRVGDRVSVRVRVRGKAGYLTKHITYFMSHKDGMFEAKGILHGRTRLKK